ncbi:MAG: pseudouridine synthase [Terracidiphilus sp.]
MTDGEGEAAVEAESESKLETEVEGEDSSELESFDSSEPQDHSESEITPKPRPLAKLERLQKILAAAGVASRRRAEELIEQGRVQVNGKVVTVLGTKADAGRDHIRVDGKLLQGAERLRYFVLNKPRGFVTTVKDPEGRPTVMQFFDKMKERLYPVGRLDYLSEGLLVVTNDGELANRLTKASSGVEKTYLVKVSGQPTEAELNILRGGVAIERGKPGSPPVRTSPARIRQVRQGDNPWYEVVLIEGRNRELRKMFEEIGHFVEKIRRVGYGPLVLDQEPGNLRELEPEELDALRKAAEGKLRTPKAKELRRRNLLDSQLPTLRPKASPRRPNQLPVDRPAQPPVERAAPRPAWKPALKPAFKPALKPTRKKDELPARPPFRPTADRTARGGPTEGRFGRGSEGTGRTGSGRPFNAKPAWKKPEREQRPPYKPSAPLRRAAEEIEDGPTQQPARLFIEPVESEQRFSRPGGPRPGFVRSGAAKPFRGEGGLARPFTTSSGKPRAGGARPNNKPRAPAGRSSSAGRKPGNFPGSGTAARSYGPPSRGPATSARSGSGPRPSGSRPSGPRPPASSRPFPPRPLAEGASDSRPAQARPYPNSASRAERKAGPGWKPKPGAPADGSSSAGWKPSYGGQGKPPSSLRNKPRPGGFSKSGYRGKPAGSGDKRTGPRPGGRPSGKQRK